ncbi:MAG: hypothetical protein PF482_03910 [Desulfobacteraceae bacterium]|jgi:hypothetical protein|nr:hypothetical protein [Desulfobacteraceae bacterium]
MRFIVTPEFSEKVSSLSRDGISAISTIANFISETDRNSLTQGNRGIEVRSLTGDIVVINYSPYRLFASFGSDSEGEYLLLMDVSIEASQVSTIGGFFATKDPRRNQMFDPNRNMTIDPRRNMTIDPNRNMTIDPRRNRYYGGPYIYNTQLKQVGFLVRANENVSLIFDMSARFISYIVSTGSGNLNIFDISGAWIGFLVPTQNEVLLHFDAAARWIGIII